MKAKKLVASDLVVRVLILIVMEDTHEVMKLGAVVVNKQGLNPYCNGRYS